ncbi:MAG TPA: hybrid sensor histidine kinase/response regulator, partial [Steroidobacteraceae bacterium]|nr:hybrid sensor histidine kinase/response regulator [Steroidobacteraceae bacterium]
MPVESPACALLVAAEQVRTQYRSMPVAIIANAAVSVILCFALRGAVSPGSWAAWLCAEYLWVGGCLLLWRAFNRAQSTPSDIARWRNYAIAGCAYNGIAWGIGGIVLYVPGNLSSQVLVGIMPVLFLAVTTHFAVVIWHTIRNSAQLRFKSIQLIDELREASAAKSRFLASASHDLRQPLHALGFFVDALPEHTSPAGKPVVENIRRSLSAMDELFSSLLDVSRLEAGVVESHIATVPVASLLERIQFEFEPLARRKGLALTVIRSSAWVRSDPALLERIIRNFVSNAVRYTDRGGLVVGCRPRADQVRIDVWDSGRGIPASRHQEIFQEFRQLDNPERDHRNGFGLGLAIVERVARLLDHPIELRSVVGKGSRFSVIVPRGRSEEQVRTARQVRPPLDADVSGALVLLVDDEISVRDGIEDQMRRWRCEVISAGSGAEIIDKMAFLQRMPDLIVSVYRLRNGESGIRLVETVREEFSADIPA